MKLLTSLMFILAVSVSSAQQVTPTSTPEQSVGSAPQEISIDTSEIDFGEIFWGSPVSHVFTISNTSDQTVSIPTIRADCGCTAILDNQAPMNPGESRKLTVTYEPENTEGKINKRITLYTEIRDEANSVKWLELNLHGTIVNLLTFDPPHVYFKKVFWGDTPEETVTIRADKGKNIRILGVKSGSEHLRVTSDSTTESSGTSNSATWVVTVKLAGSAPVGTFKTQVTVLTDNELQPAISFNVLAYIRGLISLFPTQCYLGTLTPGQTVEKTFDLEKSGEVADLILPVIKETPAWLSTTVETIQENKKYAIKASITIPEDMKGKLSGSFVIETSDTNVPRFEVPVFGYVLPSGTPAEEQPDLTNPASESGPATTEGSSEIVESETEKTPESR